MLFYGRLCYWGSVWGGVEGKGLGADLGKGVGGFLEQRKRGVKEQTPGARVLDTLLLVLETVLEAF